MYLTLEQSEDVSIVKSILTQVSDKNINYQKLTSANAYVYCVGDEYIKLPISLCAEKALRREIGISNFLSRRVSFSVPYFEYGQIEVDIDGKPCNLFFAKSKKIRGIPLFKATMRAISHQMFVGSLVDVLDELHSLPINDMATLNVPTFKSRIDMLMGATAQTKYINPRFKSHIFKMLRSHLGGEEKDVLCHRDLHGANVFVNPMTGGVTGVLDFGLAELAPPAVEMADIGVYANMGLAARITETYKMKTGRFLGDLYLYHPGDRNKWLQQLIVSYAKEVSVPTKVSSCQSVLFENQGRIKQ